ncbi:hypothetical protein FC48_GL000739 [Ligilactobacillus murinus DSM 20452 = NBRC 14221]|uniref:Uncharacterized protein n=2 Tax=Ligilactobacillus murinus TaxID=1622 RepID=A0A0R2BM76_9LACO|nr:hypothetical protein [Ligilactobacillus murinus]KRM77083.1 hypothetical protein FC48_GL000739 [Ligilactobacillus murinus DSM 20452 = NBRC 14221]MDO4457164.1 hypothetical protein [Ligilactobacillus murinus]BDI02495.1 hypothetical protein LmYK1_17350 [Ligilactobacillus murinus]GFI63062.1 hypothetical protein IMSAG117_00472 [Lactobacillaceae bacterium]
MDGFLQLMLIKVIFFLPLLTILVASLVIMLIVIKTKKMSPLAKFALVVIFGLISLLMVYGMIFVVVFGYNS